jgi:hypothetical protein
MRFLAAILMTLFAGGSSQFRSSLVVVLDAE